MVISSLQITWWELTGLLGAAIYAGSYLSVAFDKLSSQSKYYYLFQMIAAGTVLLSLTHSFNLASVTIQVFFICVSVIGFLRHSGSQGPTTRRGAADKSPVVVHFSQSETADKNWRRRSDFG